MLAATMVGEASEARERGYFGSGAVPDQVIAGRYRVIREIGAGGMGQVVEVEHLELEKRFALKLIRPDRWDETLDARFRREARALAKVSSPRVAQVTDFGVDDERGPFYIMELVDGEALDALIKRSGPMPRERALEIAIGIAEALIDVHAVGIVHRDVKPGNIGICADGPLEVRLLDFGLATSTDERFGSRITESHRVVGSMPYMAPEQFHGHAPTPSVDLWALGVVVYEMLSGKLPFEAPTTAALIQKILNESPPPLPAHNGGRLLSRLLAKDAAMRPQSAEEALHLIEDCLLDPGGDDAVVETAEATRVEPAAAVPTPRKWPRALGFVLAAVGLLGIGASVGTWSTREPAPPAEVPAQAPVAAHQAPPSVEPAPAADEPRDPAPFEDDEAVDAQEPERTVAPSAEATLDETVPPRAPRTSRRRPPATDGTGTAAAAPEEEVPSEPEADAWDGTIIESATP